MSLSQTQNTMRSNENAWLGTPSRQMVTSSQRPHQGKTIKRKPPPPITPDLLEQPSKPRGSTANSESIPITLTRPTAPQIESRRPSALTNDSLVPAVTTISRKTSITGQLKNALRRRSSTAREPLAPKVMNISTPTDFKHVSGIPHESVSRSRSSVSSMRSSIASGSSADLVFRLSPLPEHAQLPDAESLMPSLLQTHAPARSVRRPSRSNIPSETDSSHSTSLRDKRKALYATSFVESDVMSSISSPNQPSVSTSERSLSSTLDYHARMHRHYHTRTSSLVSTGEQSPELSRSPSSTFSSLDSDSECNSRNAMDLTDLSDYPRLYNSSVKPDTYSAYPSWSHVRSFSGSHASSANFF